MKKSRENPAYMLWCSWAKMPGYLTLQKNHPLSGQALDKMFAVAAGLNVDTPIFVPDAGIDGGKFPVFGQRAQGVEFPTEAGAKRLPQHGLGNQESGVLHADHIKTGIEAGSGSDGVDVRMEKQAAVPRMQNHGEAAGGGTHPAGIFECGRERARGSREKRVVECLR